MLSRSIACSVVLLMIVSQGSALAEVKIEDRGELRLEQHPMAGGIWASRQPEARGVVNARGDLMGDGAPTHAVRDSELFAAWVRPADDSIQWSRANSVIDIESGAIQSADGAVGLPLVISGGGVIAPWAVAWQAYDQGEAVVRLAGVAAEAGPVLDLGSGFLVGALAVGESVHLLTLDDRGLSLSTVVFVSLPDIPDDIPLARLVSRSRLDLGVDAKKELSSIQGRAVICAGDETSVWALRVAPGRVAEIEVDEGGLRGVIVRHGALPKCAR